MKFMLISLALPSLGEAAKLRATGGPRGQSVRMDAPRYLQATSCLGTFSTAFTVDKCTSSSVQAAVSDAMSDEPNCSGVAVGAELSVLLGAAEADVTAALDTKCNEAFEGAKVPFRQMTKRGDAFDREYFHGGSDWNDQYQVTYEGSTYHALSDDASRIMHEYVLSETQGKHPIEFPSYLPSFEACSVNAVMCCHVTDRQANDRGGLCTGDSDDCSVADPLSNTDVCLSSMEDSPIAARVKRGLAVYHLNSEGNPSEGSVNCHGFAWSEEDSRYAGNLLFDVAMKQSLYDRGYVKNVPGSPMCGCIEQMPVVTRSDCTKVGSTSETYTLSSTGSALSIELSVSAIELVQCDADEDLKTLYKELNPASPNAIDTKLVANCTDSVDSKMATHGYKRSTLEVTEAMLSPVEVVPAIVTLKFNAEVASDIAAADFKIYDAADSTTEQLQITSAVTSGLSINLELATLPSSDSSYQVSNLVQVEKKLARMVTLEANSVHALEPSSWNYINIGSNWRMGFACETCSKSHFSFSSSSSGQTAMILRDTGTQHRGPRTDYHLFDFGANTGPSYSLKGVEFGNKAIQIRDWRIKQIDDTHISISTANGNVARIYRSDGTIHGNNRDFNGFISELGEPTCAYVTSDYVQVGDWRIGAYDATHLSVSHRRGLTAQIYRGDGTTHRGPRTDYNTWTFPDGEVLMGTKDGCVQPGVPNILQIGLNWRIAEIYDTNHLSFSARQPDGQSGNGAKTATIYRNDGTAHRGPRTDFNAFGDVPTYSSSNPVVYGNKAIEIDEWRIVQIDERHLSVSHSGGGVSRVYSNNGYVKRGSATYSGWQRDLGTPTCAFMTEKFLQLGDWRIAEMDENHLSVSHRNGYTSSVYRRDGTFHSGWGSKSWNGWDLVATNVLQGSTDGCASIQDALLVPVGDGSGSRQVLVKFNKPMDDSSAETSLYRIYDKEGHQDDLNILSASISATDQSLLELNIAGVPSGVTYNVMTVDQVRTRSSVITVPAENSLAIEVAHWDYVEIGGWRFARTCETCSSGSHFSVSSQRLLKTSQIFRDTGSTHRGPRSDFHGFDLVTSSGLTYSSQPIMFGDKGVQIRDWRIRQIDATHLSVSSENGNVSRIYRADGTVHGNNKDFSGYKIEELGEPTCSYLTPSYLQIGDWRFGEISTHLSVTHKGGKTAMIYRDDGRIFKGPRTDYNAWGLQDEEILMGSNEGCGETTLFA